mmetsp:Transcript_96910/g.172499  ORF Transcript_96910/g.172499 Transcript_96910/m.172499 type:complete len:195 (-) Transcript_96910:88-672(-)|eukprot:CAMPEP_0197656094 /NCGR_PEP_ID=MMETSP1338-20131121/40199_1 /TAXON_ID=43686 ORGANISM="Pelagodinium beii, Strain RCC1491" /NCGR_SAMPLE_ID=MMETSP1338 /ASSEMBLY_ACC=CAM_ASM_000754 /LENGTH=194 /DNA_ID=CAMNT_0043231913 /DNA_START=45 /DNA_END=629 /DNA_ORIENTATION=+
MYGLRKGGGNHYAMFAGSRSDFIVVGHPEFNIGKLASEKGVGGQWDTRRCPSRPARGHVMEKLRHSMNESSPRLRGPRQQGLTLKERALERASSAPSLSRHSPSGSFQAADSLSKAMKEFQLSKGMVSALDSPAEVTPSPHEYLRHQKPTGMGKYNYAIPEQALPFLATFDRSASEMAKFDRPMAQLKKLGATL